MPSRITAAYLLPHTTGEFSSLLHTGVEVIVFYSDMKI
jgi:hypothetical protein